LAILLGELNPSEIIDPESIPELSTTAKKVKTDRFVCPQCGARMVYTTDGQSLYCEHCGYNNPLTNSTKEAKEQDFFVGMAIASGHQSPVATQVFFCEGCGAKFILSPQTISATCAYCGSPHVIRSEKQQDILSPNGIIPINYTQKTATRVLEIWLQKHKTYQKKILQPLNGVYLPAWTFDIVGSITYHEEIDDSDFIELEMVNHKSTIPREFYIHLDDLCVPASRRMQKLFKSMLSTYDLKEIRDYEPDFLANWGAEVYDIPMADASLDARELALDEGRHQLKVRLPGISVAAILPGDIQVTSFKLVLLPVWMSTIQLEAKACTVMVNGQNGAIVSNCPFRERGFAGWLKSFLDG